MSKFIPEPHDRDTAADSEVALGLIVELRDNLTSKARKEQVSFRHILFSSFQTIHAIYVDFFHTTEQLKSFRCQRPHSDGEIVRGMDPDAEGRYIVLFVSGDFLFQWNLYKELIRRLSAGETPRWCSKLGGRAFHDLKVETFLTLTFLIAGETL